jgi:hypothetical protein
MEQITENLCHVLSSHQQIPFSQQKLENILCSKVYQMRTKSTLDKWFCDLAFRGQMLFTCEGGGLCIAFPSNRESEEPLVEDFLVTKWAYGNILLSVEEIIGKLGMSDKEVPAAKEASTWSVPDDLMFGRACTKVQFDIGHKVAFRCESFF